ncbi:hypothetical protein [Nocardia suismassiliense]|uniref:hypothetical protein n=1 Tax=Nocardia suismassiliense TaxID=2077092 RepID=UPI00131F4726|nr:hypothetical protein [Nocardia suismassiliense]
MAVAYSPTRFLERQFRMHRHDADVRVYLRDETARGTLQMWLRGPILERQFRRHRHDADVCVCLRGVTVRGTKWLRVS